MSTNAEYCFSLLGDCSNDIFSHVNQNSNTIGLVGLGPVNRVLCLFKHQVKSKVVFPGYCLPIFQPNHKLHDQVHLKTPEVLIG